MKKWLQTRLTDEDYAFNPDFAFLGTVNWINCLAQNCNVFYPVESMFVPELQEKANSLSVSNENRVFECLFMAQHSLVGLNTIVENITFPSDVCKLCVYAWYDCILNSIRAMVISNTGIIPQNEIQLEKLWFELVEEFDFIPVPFRLQIKDLTEHNVKNEIESLRNGNSFTLNSFASNYEQAFGGLVSYLSGTIKYYVDCEKNKLLESELFMSLNILNFRTNKAKEYRDAHLSNLTISFLSCLTRFKGKVLERDSIFLSYGNVQDEKVTKMLNDLLLVAKCFSDIAEQFCAKNIDSSTWRLFRADLDENSRLTAIF
ncbi:hypothetical protein [Pantoea agglomerans]|uniref:Uncharacterized protein n=1 Tax=Enterobacter agglomerans TaxID=549 RepID=A0A379AE48_ENTAG|nr:hypothetical protein [Pantoea agglomerans]QXB56928.1 hypothetical protein I6L77_09525 [Pantoea agglomerans]SUB16116.1 Uncharacterised protein [Pantoea agglomerans]